MAKRLYTLQDVYDYLFENYGIEWVGYKVVDEGIERRVRNFDFSPTHTDNLTVIALAYKGSRLKKVSLEVCNEHLRLWEISPNLRHFRQAEIAWQDFLAVRHAQQGQGK